jgi:putative transposase
MRDRGADQAAERIRFTSAILPRWARRTRSLDALLPILYLRGVSMGDFQEALAALLGKDAPNLSPSVVARLRGEWEADFARWQRRDLSARHYVYVWADGVYLQARMEPQAECMLVLIGATPEGKKELLGFQVGMRESAQSWRELLVDLKARGLAIAPEVATGEGRSASGGQSVGCHADNAKSEHSGNAGYATIFPSQPERSAVVCRCGGAAPQEVA